MKKIHDEFISKKFNNSGNFNGPKMKYYEMYHSFHIKLQNNMLFHKLPESPTAPIK